LVRPHIFANGGDRKLDNIPEIPVCNEIGCATVFNVGKGGKIQSSSWLLKKHFERVAAEGKKGGGVNRRLKKD
jgi:D-beta-D-heptose 7-phosphate kinase/D-beta-D-heptose 1-phosphate adenosyltransferase